jgi:hypothetical protein
LWSGGKKNHQSRRQKNLFLGALSLSFCGRFGNQDCEEEEEEEEEVVFPPWTQARCREDFESEEKKNVEFLFFFCSSMFVLLQSWETHDGMGREGKKGREGKL